MRETLIELLQHDDCPLFMVFGDNVEVLADYLIANGVTISAEIEELKADNERLRDMWAKAVSDASKAEAENKARKWIPVTERLPKNFVSVLGYMTDAGEFPPVRECYTVGNAFFFPALGDKHPVSHWCEMPQPPKGE